MVRGSRSCLWASRGQLQLMHFFLKDKISNGKKYAYWTMIMKCKTSINSTLRQQTVMTDYNVHNCITRYVLTQDFNQVSNSVVMSLEDTLNGIQHSL